MNSVSGARVDSVFLGGSFAKPTRAGAGRPLAGPLWPLLGQAGPNRARGSFSNFLSDFLFSFKLNSVSSSHFCVDYFTGPKIMKFIVGALCSL